MAVGVPSVQLIGWGSLLSGRPRVQGGEYEITRFLKCGSNIKAAL
jgi:hypothetical protein